MMAFATRWFLVPVVAIGACLQTTAAATGQGHAAGVFEAYDGGNYSSALDTLSARGALDKDAFSQFKKAAEDWVGATRESTRWRRTLVAATVALEAAHLLRDHPSDQAGEYLVWAARRIRDDAPRIPSETEHLWYLACLAGMEELEEPWVLAAGVRSSNVRFDRQRSAFGDGGFIALARRRFPEELRFTLAEVEVFENETTGPYLYRRLAPSYFELAAAQAAKTAPQDPRQLDNETERSNVLAGPFQGRQVVRALSRLPAVQLRYRDLSGNLSVQSEATLHIAYLDCVLGRWPTAIVELRSVATMAQESYLRYLADYLIGRSAHNLGDHVAATEAFERAVRILPRGRSALSWLAAELWLSDNAADRDRAEVLLRNADVGPTPPDPWQEFSHGDARLWLAYRARLREALR